MDEVMRIIADAMEALGLAYDFEEYGGEVTGPYWVGHYAETTPTTEDGLQEADFTLTGTTRGTWLELQSAVDAIRAKFPSVSGLHGVTAGGTGYAIFYASSVTVPTDVADLKRIETTLNVKYWRA